MASEKVISQDGEVIVPYQCKPRSYSNSVTPLGDKWKISAKLSVDPVTGSQIAEPGERIDLDAYIQASRASCDIVTIIAKLKAGDESVINVKQGFYGDTTILPKDINDINAIEKMSSQARESFDKLPDAVKALFNNDPSEFFSAVLDRSAENIINAYVVQMNEQKQSEAVASEGE